MGKAENIALEFWLKHDGYYRSRLANGQDLVITPPGRLRGEQYTAQLLLLTDRGWTCLLEQTQTKAQEEPEEDFLSSSALVEPLLRYAQFLYPGQLIKPKPFIGAQTSQDVWLWAEGCLLSRLADGRTLMIQPDEYRSGNQYDARLLLLTEMGWVCQQELRAVKPSGQSAEEFTNSFSIAKRLMTLAAFQYPGALTRPQLPANSFPRWDWAEERLHTRLCGGQILMIAPERPYCGHDYVARLFLLTVGGWKLLRELKHPKPAAMPHENFTESRPITRRLMEYAQLLYAG